MQNLNLSLLAILITLSLMPQSTLFSMEQHQDQIIYVDENHRIFNGQLQEVVRHEYRKIDGTITVIEEWIPKQ